MEEVPGRTSLLPLAFPHFVHCLIRVEAEGLLDCQGRAGIISIVRWNLRPVIFGVENGPNTVSGSTVSNTELSEFFWGSLSSGERTQRVLSSETSAPGKWGRPRRGSSSF